MCALSYADIPVVTPSEASIEIVKLVSCFESVSVFINGKFNCLHLSLVRVKQINPLAYLLIKFISSGVTLEAAIMKSPSFSLLSSSTIKTIFPFLRSSSISSVFDNIKFSQSLLLISFSICSAILSISILTIFPSL